jgi:pimeloyl-ACP methyl ester carboxylesterase
MIQGLNGRGSWQGFEGPGRWRGRIGGLLPHEEQERRAAAIPDARLKVYPDTGHAVSWERPEWVVRDLEELMKDTRPA